MARHQSYTWIKNWGEEVRKNAVGVLSDEKTAQQVSSKILERTLRRATRPGSYNQWSGNLARSYVVQISSKEAYYLFKTRAGAGNTKTPVVYTINYSMINEDRKRNGKRKKLITPPKSVGKDGYTKYFKLTKKYHAVNISRKVGRRGVFRLRGESSIDNERKKDQYWRRIQPIEDEVRFRANYPHWYLPKSKLRSFGANTNKWGVQVIIGNETPYRKFVEKKYEVLSQKERETYKQIIKEAYGEEIGIVVKRVCNNINRDLKTGRFIKG